MMLWVREAVSKVVNVDPKREQKDAPPQARLAKREARVERLEERVVLGLDGGRSRIGLAAGQVIASEGGSQEVQQERGRTSASTR